MKSTWVSDRVISADCEETTQKGAPQSRHLVICRNSLS